MSRELLFSVTKKNFDITHFSGTGGGGQHRNKHQNCVRIKHKESGVITTGQSHKERKANMKDAFNNMVSHPKFKVWLSKQVYELSEQCKDDKIAIERKVNEAMKEENLKVEYEMC